MHLPTDHDGLPKDYRNVHQEPEVSVQEMVLMFTGKNVSAETYDEVVMDRTMDRVKEQSIPLGLAEEIKHYRHELGLNLLMPNPPDKHFVVARKIGNGPWVTAQIDRPEDFYSEEIKLSRLKHKRVLEPQPAVFNFSGVGVDNKFLDNLW